MFEQAFKNIDDVLWKDAGCTSELDYTEQTSWLLFLKYLDALEHEKATEAKLGGKKYSHILDQSYRWDSWAAPKGKDGKIDHNTAQTGDDLIAFVNGKLFPYLHGFKAKATGPNTIEYKIGEIFGEIKNRIQSGYNLREIIDHVDELRFQSQNEKHELSHLYESKIKNMGNAGRNGGEYYTPRPLIRSIVAVTAPRLGETICDPAVGSAGFLCESFDYLRTQNPKRTVTQDRALQERTFYGKEKKSLAYVIAIMNMILHGIEAPNIIHTNTLAENLADVQEKDRFDIILANPPFGGKERKEVQQNFPIRTGETAFLFLQHFIKLLKAGGRAGIVIKNTFLSNTDNASVSLRQKLLEECNLHTVLDCPGGTFIGAGVKTVVLFFEKGTKTRKVWFYQLDPGRNMGKTNPLNDADLAEFIALQKTKADSPKSWSVDVAAIDPMTFDLSVKNPNGGEEIAHRSPQDIMDEIAALDAESAEVLGNIKGALFSGLGSLPGGSSMPQPLPEKLYFAYGSNLGLGQMRKRCPTYEVVGKATLPSYRWQINARGFANILPSAGDYVEGILYKLSATDQHALNSYEVRYSKEIVTVKVNASAVEALVYIDPNTDEGTLSSEYGARIKVGIIDAKLSPEYVAKYLMPYLPTDAESAKVLGNIKALL
jgi:type I restriction enzyme M protein